MTNKRASGDHVPIVCVLATISCVPFCFGFSPPDGDIYIYIFRISFTSMTIIFKIRIYFTKKMVKKFFLTILKYANVRLYYKIFNILF